MDWDEAAAVLDTVVAATFDRAACTCIPMRDGLSSNHDRVEDEARDRFDFLASFERSPDAVVTSDRRPLDPGAPAQSIRHEIVMTASIAEWPYRPRRGDMIIHGGQSYHLADYSDDRSGRPAFYLDRAKGPMHAHG